jgi:hypothetical protein
MRVVKARTDRDGVEHHRLAPTSRDAQQRADEQAF